MAGTGKTENPVANSVPDSQFVTKDERMRVSLPAKAAKPRIECIDGCRFALVLPIVIGHFVKYGTSKPWLLKLLTQENVLVGGFFVISGYVMGYVTTSIGERSCEKKKLEQPELFFWQKVMSYYPLHFVVSTGFAPLFIWVDRFYKNPWHTTGFRALLNYTMMQAWFPSEAEIWNPPTWFLSALTFGNFTMPSMVLPQVARLSKDGLWKLVCGLSVYSLLQKVSYSKAWQFNCRGNWICDPKEPFLWNVTRFHPFSCLVEITMGIAAVRNVMLDERQPQGVTTHQPLLFFLASHASLFLRLTPKLNLNDAMIRSALFVPLYLKFLMSIHRDSLSISPSGITRIFGSQTMVWLGSLAFPMFILHGPIGQLFYKRVIATRLWGQVMPHKFFPAYLLLVILASHLANENFVKSKTVQSLSTRAARFLAHQTEGMLRDRIYCLEDEPQRTPEHIGV
jgi:peptidoglycan/LPS O-acetylase OafA/YrhL